jgi:hypothetical protein
MIRRARSLKRSGRESELLQPSPEEIRRLTEEIRRGWSPSQHARRAGLPRRVEVPMVQAPDLSVAPNDDSI